MLFNTTGAIVNTIVAFIFGYAGTKLNKLPSFRRVQEKISGVILIALGLRIALLKHK